MCQKLLVFEHYQKSQRFLKPSNTIAIASSNEEPWVSLERNLKLW